MGTTRRTGTTLPRRRDDSLPMVRFVDRSLFSVFLQEALVVNRRSALTFALVLVAGAAPLYAQTAEAAGGAGEIAKWSIITAGFALAFAAGLGALAQGRGVSAAAEAIARNPGAAGDIRGSLILGLVLIESLVIYVLLISLILFFLKPFSA
jgi:F-type H+-transporting ATPase subunit c